MQDKAGTVVRYLILSYLGVYDIYRGSSRKVNAQHWMGTGCRYFTCSLCHAIRNFPNVAALVITAIHPLLSSFLQWHYCCYWTEALHSTRILCGLGNYLIRERGIGWISHFFLHLSKCVSSKAPAGSAPPGFLAQRVTCCMGSPQRGLDLNGETQAATCLLLYFLEPKVRPFALLTNNVFH